MQPEPELTEQTQSASNYDARVLRSALQLKALSDAYFGLGWALRLSVVVLIGCLLLINQVFATEFAGAAIFGCCLLLGLCVTLSSYGPNRNVALGRGWSPSWGFAASLLMGMSSWLLIGLFGFAIMQHAAFCGLHEFGVKTTGFGVKKQDVDDLLAKMGAFETAPKEDPAPNELAA